MKSFTKKILILLGIIFGFQSCEKNQDSSDISIEGLYTCKVVNRTPYMTNTAIDLLVIAYDEEESDTTVNIYKYISDYYLIPTISSEILLSYEENEFFQNQYQDSDYDFIDITVTLTEDSLEISKLIFSDYLEYDGAIIDPVLYISEKYFCTKP